MGDGQDSMFATALNAEVDTSEIPPALQEQLEAAMTEEVPSPPQQRLTTMFDIIQGAVMPPTGTPMQLVACNGCGQPLILSMALAVTGQVVVFPMCINSLCASKRAATLMPAGAGVPGLDLRNLKGR